MSLPDALLDLLRRPSPCFLSTLMPDGSPQMTQTWVDTDGHDVLINTVRGHQKVRNVERDPREHIDELSQRYIGAPYPWFGGRDQVRLLVRISPDKGDLAARLSTGRRPRTHQTVWGLGPHHG